MNNRCEDCGCNTVYGVCSNCHEELYIVSYQNEFIDRPLSHEFLQKAEEQSGQVATKIKGMDNE